MTWKPELVYGNFTIVARLFPGSSDQVNTSTASIGLDSNNTDASLTMGFHGAGWIGGGGGPHEYQIGVYAHNRDKAHKRPHLPRINTTENLADYNTFGFLWSPGW